MTPTAVLQIDATNNLINVADSTNYPAIPFFLAAVGIARLEYPPGILYQNAGYALNNFGAPDIIYPGTLNFDTAIPLISGLIPEGNYVLKYKNQVSKQTTLLVASTADNSISVDILVDDVVPGMSMVFAGGANNGTRIVQAVTTDGFGRHITFTTPIVSNTATGTVTWVVGSSTIVTIDYCNVTPKVSITQEYRCDSNPPLFIDTDTSTYAITVNGISLTPSVINRTHWTRPPRGISNTPVFADVLSAVAANVTTQLWTGNWTTDISTDLVYNIPAYGGNTAYTLTQTVTGQSNIIVKCDSCLCNLAICINRVRTDYEAALIGRTADLPALRDQLISLEADYMAYSLFKQCGDNEKLAEIIASIRSRVDCDCVCDDEDDDIPRQIIPEYPIAINGVTAVVVPGNIYITVTPVTAGGTTTYTVGMSVINVQALMASYLTSNPSLVTTIVNNMGLKLAMATSPTSFDIPIVFTGDCDSSTAIISNVVMAGGLSISDIEIGDVIFCFDFPNGVWVTAIGITSITLSQNANNTQIGTAGSVSSKENGISITKYKRSIAGINSFFYEIDGASQNSIETDSATFALQLVNDQLTPGNSKYYGTGITGIKGYQSFPFNSTDFSINTFTIGAGAISLKNISNAIPTGRYTMIINMSFVDGAVDDGAYTAVPYKDGVLVPGSGSGSAYGRGTGVETQMSFSRSISITLGQMLQLNCSNGGASGVSVYFSVTLIKIG